MSSSTNSQAPEPAPPPREKTAIQQVYQYFPSLRDPSGQTRALGTAMLVLGTLALLVPLWPGFAPEGRLGVWLLLAGLLHIYHCFRRADPAERRSGWTGGVVTLLLGFLLMRMPELAGGAVLAVVAAWFAFDACRYALKAVRSRQRAEPYKWELLAAAGNLAIVFGLLALGPYAVLWTIAIAVALRIFGTGADILHAREFGAQDAGDTVVQSLGLAGQPEMDTLANRLEAEEETRGPVDRIWIITFLVTLLAIHVGRMGFDRTAFGLMSPGFAVFGDVVVALIIAYGVVVPFMLVWQRLSGPLERRAWRWCLGSCAPGERPSRLRGLAKRWLTFRMRLAIRLRLASYSLPSALGRGLQIGLPGAAILAATTPIWGMSWYFDSENWASGIWNSWAEARTDSWREAMIRAVQPKVSPPSTAATAFAVQPPGLDAQADFSFVVIGDTGEGDASQHVLRDQLLAAAAQPDVKFVVLSSDVVYPTGAMRDYEARFWLPFKGVTKPVYAIPGNHDWYDALEGFAATFLEPDFARIAMQARVDADLNISASTEEHIDSLIRRAAFLRGQYGVPTGFQQAPFFQVQTGRFALFVADTGVRKRLDDAQLDWLRAALESASGKFKMVILGHPLYASGEYRAAEGTDFRALHDLLRRHQVRVVMAGDTHDLEYYREARGGGQPPIHHFVNGGGGAFLTIGAQLAPRDKIPSEHWAFYPARQPLVEKIAANNPFWKRPAWWWTVRFNCYPFSAEWLSAAFDYNVSPFFQSFVEVRVEPSKKRVRFLPWGNQGRLKWSDLDISNALKAETAVGNAFVEWTVPME